MNQLLFVDMTYEITYISMCIYSNILDRKFGTKKCFDLRYHTSACVKYFLWYHYEIKPLY